MGNQCCSGAWGILYIVTEPERKCPYRLSWGMDGGHGGHSLRHGFRFQVIRMKHDEVTSVLSLLICAFLCLVMETRQRPHLCTYCVELLGCHLGASTWRFELFCSCYGDIKGSCQPLHSVLSCCYGDTEIRKKLGF